jgi:hypothetical protein
VAYNVRRENWWITIEPGDSIAAYHRLMVL